MFTAAREWLHGQSLANKCLLLFGAASALIIAVALTVPWLRMNALVGAGENQTSREIVSAWLLQQPPRPTGRVTESGRAELRELSVEQARNAERGFITRALRAFESDPERSEVFGRHWEGFARVYAYARAVRDADGELTGLVTIERISADAALLLVINALYVIAAGAVVLALALVVFAVLTNRLILRPVRALHETAERIHQGDTGSRADIKTGDEFEDLAGTFNVMMRDLEAQQEQLRAINRAMDVKLGELAQANSALAEASKLKGDFLAGVSHELRTPLNSIIGFAELLHDRAKADRQTLLAVRDDSETSGAPRAETLDRVEKRERYLTHILEAGRGLLDLIEGLLEMARAEAGKIELDPSWVDPVELCQGLVGLIQPQAQRRGATVSLRAVGDVPLIETDQRKCQQIVFNLVSNAVKFCGGPDRPGEVEVRVERLPAAELGSKRGAVERVRISVIDDGPGIAPKDRELVFEKFHQLEGGHTRVAGGTGLRLAICRELTSVLQGELQLESEPGAGTMFSVILPLSLDLDEKPRTARKR